MALKKPLLAFLLTLLMVISAAAQQRTLDFYIAKGLSNSPLLNDYKYQLKSGSLDSMLVLSALRPQLNLSSQAMYAPSGHNFGYDAAITNGGNYTAVVDARQSLLNGKVKSAQLQNISLLKQMLEVNNRITRSDLEKAITIQYILAYANYSQYQTNLKIRDLLAEQQNVVKQLTEAGIYQLTDLMNLSVNLKAQQLTCSQGFMFYKNDLALINMLCGMVDTISVALAKPELELTNPFNLNSSPIMRQYGIDSLQINNAKALIDLNYRPRLEAFTDLGFMSILPKNVPHNFGVSMGLNFSMPLYDGKQRDKAYKKIEIQENTRLLNRNFYTSQYWQQQQQLMEQLRLTNQFIVEINAQLAQQQELINLYRMELEKGLVRLTDFILTINNYTLTQSNLVNAEMSRLQLINQLNYLK